MSSAGLPASPLTARDRLRSPSVEVPPPGIPEYELLRLIGRGSYGEVWLGRSVTGVYRAVKIVRRQWFESDRPYEREFRGIQAFEPVSLSHESQLNVLHVGRNNEEGYFFYILELADDANAAGLPVSVLGDWQNYSPRTLREEVKRRGRLPFIECVELGIRLATALEHLHRHGLAHRDVKPSNIVFVNGTPKLADIGLVAPHDDTMSFVGTPGYVPPEGPGAPQADIYSLGKVLYEISTGKRRDEFPDPPTLLSDDADVAAQAELNEIILRACANNCAARFGSAAELRADLVLLQSGGSVKRLRILERRMALVRKLGLVAAAVLALGTAAFVYQQQQARHVSALAEQGRRRLVRLHVANSLHLQESGDYHASMVWLVEALKLARTPTEEDIQRRRIGGLLRATPALVRMGNHDRAINHAQFSSSGQSLLTVSDDDTGCVWDVETGALKTRLAGHSGPVTHGSFSPDDRRIITASDDGTARLWDASSGELLLPPLRHDDAVRYAWFDPQGHRVVTASADGTARIWNVETGHSQVEPLRHEDEVEFACFSTDGQLVVTASRDRTAQLWDSNSGQPVAPPLVHEQGVVYAAFSPNGRFIITGSRDGMARVWDVVTGRPAGPSLPHPGRVRFLCFSPDGERFLVAAGEHMVSGETQVYDLPTREPAAPSLRHDLHVSHAVFSPDGRWIATASSDQTVRIWDAVTSAQLGPTLRHPLAVWFVEFSPDGRYLLTAGRERIWRLWDLATEASTTEWHPPLALQRSFTETSWQVLTNAYSTGRTFRFPDGHAPLSISPCGRWIVTSDPDGEAFIRNLITGEPVSQPMQHDLRIGMAQFNPDGTRLLTTSLNRNAHIWEVPTGRPISPPLRNLYPVYTAIFSPDGALIATATQEFIQGGRGNARIWNAHTGNPTVPILEHSAAVTGLSFSPDGRLLATASGAMTTESHGARLWEVNSGRLVGEIVHEENSVSSVDFSSDGRWLATGGSDGIARLWDVRTHQPIGPPLRHLRGISSLAFSPNGRLLATASADGATCLWELPAGVPATPRATHGGTIGGITFSPEGDELMVLRYDRLGLSSALLAIGPDRRPFDELEHVVEIAAGFRISDAGTTETMATAEILGLYQDPGTAPMVSALHGFIATRRWHRAQAQASELAANWFAARFHLDRLLDLEPDDADLWQRRHRAAAPLNLTNSQTTPDD